MADVCAMQYTVFVVVVRVAVFYSCASHVFCVGCFYDTHWIVSASFVCGIVLVLARFNHKKINCFQIYDSIHGSKHTAQQSADFVCQL